MPLERSDAFLDLSDPNIVLGPRKRRPTERLLENGDPLACKRVRTDMAVSDACPSTPSSSMPPLARPGPIGRPMLQVTRRPNPRQASLSSSMSPPTCPMPSPTCQPNPSSDDGTSDGAQAIMVEESDESDKEEGGDEASDEQEVTDEDDNAELGTWSITFVYFC